MCLREATEDALDRAGFLDKKAQQKKIVLVSREKKLKECANKYVANLGLVREKVSKP